MALPMPRLPPVTIACLPCNPRSMALSPYGVTAILLLHYSLFSLREPGARVLPDAGEFGNCLHASGTATAARARYMGRTHRKAAVAGPRAPNRRIHHRDLSATALAGKGRARSITSRRQCRADDDIFRRGRCRSRRQPRHRSRSQQNRSRPDLGPDHRGDADDLRLRCHKPVWFEVIGKRIET